MSDTSQTDTPQVDPRDQEITRLRQLAQDFGPLQAVADRLKEDPAAIYRIQAALDGTQQQQQPAGQQQYQQPQLTKEQLAELNQQALLNPVETMARIAQAAVGQGLQQLGSAASPYINTTAELFIETFKSRKASEDPMFKKIAPIFERELGDVNRSGLLNLPNSDRQRQLELRWNSAAAQAYRAAAAATPTNPPNLGGSGGSAPTNAKRNVFDKNPEINTLAEILKGKGDLSDEDLQSILNDIESENE